MVAARELHNETQKIRLALRNGKYGAQFKMSARHAHVAGQVSQRPLALVANN